MYTLFTSSSRIYFCRSLAYDSALRERLRARLGSMAGVKSVVGTRQAPAQVDIEVYGSVAAAAGRASSRSRYSQLAVALGFVACVALLLAGARQPAAGTHPQALAESWGSWLEGVLDTPLGLGDAAHKQKVSQVLKASVVPLTNLAAQKGKKLNIVKGSSLKTWVATGVENYARACGPARDQPCSAGQSTTAFGGVAEKAVDNGNQTSYSEGSCTHTDTQNNPWWKVNIARQISVTGVRIVGRDDGVANRLQGFNVYVGNHNYEPDANAVCAQNQDAPAAPDYAVDVTCSTPLKGQYVYVTVPGENKILTLCEVQVHGNELPPDQGGFDPWGVSNQGVFQPSKPNLHLKPATRDLRPDT
jgi:hypothetical protein